MPTSKLLVLRGEPFWQTDLQALCIWFWTPSSQRVLHSLHRRVCRLFQQFDELQLLQEWILQELHIRSLSTVPDRKLCQLRSRISKVFRMQLRVCNRANLWKDVRLMSTNRSSLLQMWAQPCQHLLKADGMRGLFQRLLLGTEHTEM